MTRRKHPAGTPANDAEHPEGGSDSHPAAIDFELYNCDQPLEVVVEEVGSDARAIGLSREEIHRTVKKLMVSAGLYSKEGTDNHLHVGVSVSGPTYSVEVRLMKELFDPESKRLGVAPSWRTAVGGVHGGDERFVLSILSKRVKLFMERYRKANAPLC